MSRDDLSDDWFVDRHVDAYQEKETEKDKDRQEKIHDGPCQDDQHAGPDRFRVEAPLHVGGIVGIHAGNPVVTAQRQDAQGVQSLPFPLLPEVRPKADGKFVDPHTRQFGRDEMAELMDGNEDAEDKDTSKDSD